MQVPGYDKHQEMEYKISTENEIQQMIHGNERPVKQPTIVIYVEEIKKQRKFMKRSRNNKMNTS